MSEEYKRGYRDGFADGWDQARFITPTLAPTVQEHGTCKVCGMKFTGAIGYVCSNLRCPSMPVATSVTGGQSNE